jgi:hypothetical protein
VLAHEQLCSSDPLPLQVLIAVQFVYSVNLTKVELYFGSGSTALRQFGLYKATGAVSCLPFYIKTVLALPFFVMLLLYLMRLVLRFDFLFCCCCCCYLMLLCTKCNMISRSRWIFRYE